jgi:hypothetical protein
MAYLKSQQIPFVLRLREDRHVVRAGEHLPPAASAHPRCALARYRRRWTIETLFGNLKTKGFHLEDTHLTDPGKLSTLLAVLAMAVALSVKADVAAARIKPIAIKTHGRKAVSLFALGLAVWRKLFTAMMPTQWPDQVFAALRKCLSPQTAPKSLILQEL